MFSVMKQICRNFNNISLNNTLNLVNKSNLTPYLLVPTFNTQIKHYSNVPTPTAYEIIDQKEEQSERQCKIELKC